MLRPEQQKTLSHIWNGLHEQGKSAEAARLAHNELLRLTQGFDKDAVFYCELARQAVVTSESAAKKEPQLVRAFPHILHAAQTLLSTYPLHQSQEEAAQRGKFWGQSSNGNELTIATLRDALHVADVLQMIFGKEMFAPFQNGVLKVLHEISQKLPDERFSLITLTEEAPIEEAQKAFETFLQRFAPSQKALLPLNNDLQKQIHIAIPLGQFTTVSARFIGRMYRSQKYQEAFSYQQKINSYLALYEEDIREKDDPTQAKNVKKMATKEQGKAILKPLLESLRTRQWQQQYRENQQVYKMEAFAELNTLAFAGFADGITLPLHPKNR